MRLLLPIIVCLLSLSLSTQSALSWYPEVARDSLLPADWQGTIIGKNRFCLIDQGDSLMEVARWEGLGYRNLLAANPGIDPWQPDEGTGLLLPFATILPFEAQPGITINLAEFRLYLIWQHGDFMRVRVYPIGMGREGWNTPEGDFQVTDLVENPIWVRPESMRGEDPELATVIAPGPDNPLGSHWIELSADGYGIHGTNRPYGIGRRVSHGCIRLYPQDIIDLSKRIKRGTPVRIIYRPIKLAISEQTLLLQVHDDFLGRIEDPVREIKKASKALGWESLPQDDVLLSAVKSNKGVPVRMTDK